jgi:hypothetical protein
VVAAGRNKEDDFRRRGAWNTRRAEYRTYASPGRMSSARSRITVRTLSPIDPRWTGMCGALATRLPCASKIAQEKSRRSLMLTE